MNIVIPNAQTEFLGRASLGTAERPRAYVVISSLTVGNHVRFNKLA